jgi:hypothetical protein
MRKVMLVGLVFAGVAAYTTLAISAEDLLPPSRSAAI